MVSPFLSDTMKPPNSLTLTTAAFTILNEKKLFVAPGWSSRLPHGYYESSPWLSYFLDCINISKNWEIPRSQFPLVVMGSCHYHHCHFLLFWNHHHIELLFLTNMLQGPFSIIHVAQTLDPLLLQLFTGQSLNITYHFGCLWRLTWWLDLNLRFG